MPAQSVIAFCCLLLSVLWLGYVMVTSRPHPRQEPLKPAPTYEELLKVIETPTFDDLTPTEFRAVVDFIRGDISRNKWMIFYPGKDADGTWRIHARSTNRAEDTQITEHGATAVEAVQNVVQRIREVEAKERMQAAKLEQP